MGFREVFSDYLNLTFRCPESDPRAARLECLVLAYEEAARQRWELGRIPVMPEAATPLETALSRTGGISHLLRPVFRRPAVLGRVESSAGEASGKLAGMRSWKAAPEASASGIRLFRLPGLPQG
jgi:hypothetical protein